MDNIKTWTGLSVEESIRMTEDRDKWRKYVHGVANRRIEDGSRTEQVLLLSLYLRATCPCGTRRRNPPPAGYVSCKKKNRNAKNMASAGARAYMGVWGSGGEAPLKLKAFYCRREQICHSHLSET